MAAFQDKDKTTAVVLNHVVKKQERAASSSTTAVARLVCVSLVLVTVILQGALLVSTGSSKLYDQPENDAPLVLQAPPKKKETLSNNHTQLPQRVMSDEQVKVDEPFPSQPAKNTKSTTTTQLRRPPPLPETSRSFADAVEQIPSNSSMQHVSNEKINANDEPLPLAQTGTSSSNKTYHSEKAINATETLLSHPSNITPSGTPLISSQTLLPDKSLPPPQPKKNSSTSPSNNSGRSKPPPLASLTQEGSASTTCKDDLIYRRDVIATSINNKTNDPTNKYKIPRIVHQTSKSRCLVPTFYQATNTWSQNFTDWSYYFHDDEAVDKLFHFEYPEFPHLPLVVDHCLLSGTARADLWRYLVLWVYGGVYADLDSIPTHKFTQDTIKADYDGFFVIDRATDGLRLSQYFMAISPRHPLMYYAIQSTLLNIMSELDTVQFNAAMTTGSHALHDGFMRFIRSAGVVQVETKGTGVIERLTENEHLVRNGTSWGADNRSITVYGSKENKDEYIVRNAIETFPGYKKMGMVHFSEFQKKKEYQTNMTCFEAAYENTTSTSNTINRPSLSFLTQEDTSAASKNICGEGLVYRRDIIAAPDGDPTQQQEYRIPRIVHQTSKTRCLIPSFHSTTCMWNYTGWSYYFHDDEAVERLFHLDFPEFPHLRTVVDHCLIASETGAARADLWRYLVLWLYGGVYSDIDTGPNKMTQYTIEPDFDGFFVLEGFGFISQYFIAVSPRHPLMYYAIQSTLRTILAQMDSLHFNAATVTGPHALHDGYLLFLRGAGAPLETKVWDGHLRFGKNKQLVRNGTIWGAENRSITVFGSLVAGQDEWVWRIVPAAHKDKYTGLEKMGMIHFSEFMTKNKKSEHPKYNATCFDFVYKANNKTF